AFVVGEHGQNSIPLLSNISVGGAPIMNLIDSRNHHHVTTQKETLHKLHRDIATASDQVSKLKGQTSFATACSVVSLARSVLCDQRRLHPVSLLSNGFYGIGRDDVFLSLPALLGKNGIVGVPELDLSHEELARLRDTARDLYREQAHLGI
ncbi:l-lactate dehydrogenase, partial [Genlisea aurea]